MIKYSPKLTLTRGNSFWRVGDLDYGPAWVCEDFANVWDVDESKPCWLVVSDKPVRGAIRIEIAPWRVFLGGDPFDLETGMQYFGTCEEFDCFLRSFRSRVLYLWVEVPA